MITIPDIITSVENKAALVKDKHVLQGNFLRTPQGRLYHCAGGFSVVFPYTTETGEKWAFRCWHAEMSNTQKRYESISNAIKKSQLPFLTDFIYEKEGIVVNGVTYPTIRMKWVEGLPLKEYIYKNRMSRGILNNLADSFLQMTREMHTRSLAHGDLQHGNIIVDSSGAIHLIDYDSFYCPALKGERDYVTGLPDYQHPARKTNKTTSEKIDFFSELIIYISIKAIAEYTSLFDEYKVKDSDSLLFTQKDYSNLTDSKIYKNLSTRGTEFRELLSILKQYLEVTDINKLEPFESLLQKRRVTFRATPSKVTRSTDKVALFWEVPFKASVRVQQLSKNRVLSNECVGKISLCLDEKTTFKIDVKPETGPAFSKQTTVAVFDKCEVSFMADKLFVFPRVPINLSWEVKHAKKVWLDGEVVPSIGRKTVEQTKATSYILVVENELGKMEQKLDIEMLPIPQVKTILVPTPKIVNNLSITVNQPKYNAEVVFPLINIGIITVEPPQIKTLPEAKLAPKTPFLDLSKSFKAIIKTITLLKKDITRWTNQQLRKPKTSNGADS